MADEVNGWRPIETAPKDGSSILLWDGWRMQVCAWDFDDLYDREPKHWVYGEAQGEYNVRETFDDATHWMPLPAPPKRETRP